jgi:glycosyltransferase involved in cell wall biosynthesis
MRIIICVNTAWNVLNFRSGLIRALLAAGHEVIAVTPYDEYAPRLATLGCRYIELPMDNRGTHPVRDALLLGRLLHLLRREQPDVFLGYTVKPNVYGSLAARALSIHVINNIAGLGAVFIKGGALASFVRLLYRVALKKSATVFFQNPDDLKMFVEAGLAPSHRSALLPGSGVDLERFAPIPLEQRKPTVMRFVLIGRLLRDKGVLEFVQAARMVRAKWPDVQCCLLGFVDALNPAAITRAEVEAWVRAGDIEYLGISDDVRNEIGQADCIVLPSYREGTPRSLLEAAAMGRPIITTDTVGCREVVQDGHNGYLCQVANVQDLARQMERMLKLTSSQRNQMGLNGRALMEAHFSEKIVIQRYLEAIGECMPERPS